MENFLPSIASIASIAIYYDKMKADRIILYSKIKKIQT
jgi:hypothetical protein